jgi:hypothetical protein
VTIDICLPITIARQPLNCPRAIPRTTPKFSRWRFEQADSGTAAAYVTKTTVKMQIWFDSSEGSTLILRQSKGQPVLEGRYFFCRRQLAYFCHAATFSTEQQV